MIEPADIEAFRGMLGERRFFTEACDMASYETGARYDSGRAAFVACPASTAETSAVVAYCVRNGFALVPQSGNTGLVSSAMSDDSCRQGVLSLDRLTAPSKGSRHARAAARGGPRGSREMRVGAADSSRTV